MTVTDSTIANVRDQILHAANTRFGQYGYGKTTMAEIAKDCDMSAANLYRYFTSKQDIGAALAQHCLEQGECHLRDAIAAKGSTASQALETFILEALRFTYEQWSKQPRLTELVQAIVEDRTDIMLQHMKIKQRVLTDILQQGLSSGEFELADITQSAETIMHATSYFTMPLFMHLHTLKEFERIAQNMVTLVLQGLRRR